MSFIFDRIRSNHVGTSTEAASDNLIVIFKPEVAAWLLEYSQRFDPESFALMVRHVLSFASPVRPTIAQVYRNYRADVARQNQDCCTERTLDLLSMYMFRSVLECLRPEFVLVTRYGSKALRYLRRRRVRAPAHGCRNIA